MNEQIPPPHPSRAAIDALAERFGLPNNEWMQDWEYEVADPQRIDEFLGYAETGPDADVASVLMMILLQSFEDLGEEVLHDPRWERVVKLLQEQYALHRSTLHYWSMPDEEPGNWWQITPLVRSVIALEAVKRAPLA